MKIFVCWSEDRSKALARAVHEHLPKFVPGLQMFFSEDIPKGSRWFDEVSDWLDAADAGLVCVAPESIQSGWIHFEAGALARAVRKKEKGTLYTYLLNVEPGDLKGPLGEYQSTKGDREDNKKLVEAIVTAMGDGAPPKAEWEKNFDEHWPAFAAALEEIGPPPIEKLIPGIEQLFRRKTFDEPLDECTDQSWVARHNGVQQTLGELKKYERVMRADNSHLFDLYNELRAQLDGYAMDMAGLLLKEERFYMGDDGKLTIRPGIRLPCERRRLRVKQLVTQMLAPDCGPVLKEKSRRFAKMTTFEEKKALLIHPQEWRIQESKCEPEEVSEGNLLLCARSWWEFDRIHYYLVQENTAEPDVKRLLKSLDRELEILKAKDGAGSLIPMHYAVRAMKKAFSEPRAAETFADVVPAIRKMLSKIKKYLESQNKGEQARENIDEIFERLGGADIAQPAAG